MSLRDLVKDKHDQAEQTEFSAKLLSGNITVDEYSCYLTQMLAVYAILEKAAAIHNQLDGLAGVSRCRGIFDDLKEICSNKFYTMLPATRAYVDYLTELAEGENNGKKILAHVYVRHMGDLHGGQIIAKKVPGAGKFYQFTNRKELIDKLREKLSDDLAEEANVAFDFTINIMKELNESSLAEVDTSPESIDRTIQ